MYKFTINNRNLAYSHQYQQDHHKSTVGVSPRGQYGNLYYIYSNVNKVLRIDSSCNNILSVT